MAFWLARVSVPAFRVVDPVKVFAPERVALPAPDLIRDPEPEMAPE
jgi:hypothetical protein